MKNLVMFIFLFPLMMTAAEIQVDRYGQLCGESWEGKITSDADFQRDIAEEEKWLSTLPRKQQKLDDFGGVIGELKFRASGFFRVEKAAGKWWFVTPEGNPYILISADDTNPASIFYSTPLRENKELRSCFTELPDREKAATAYELERTKGRINFLAGNFELKYGPDWKKKSPQIVKKRFAALGFNGGAKWSYGHRIGMPYIEDIDLKVTRFGKTIRAIDPFDPAFPAAVDSAARTLAERCSKDPMLIAYSVENENGWGVESVNSLLREGEKCAGKRSFLEFMLKSEADSIERLAALFPGKGNSIDELMKSELSTDNIPETKVREFVRIASVKYHKTLAEALKKYDPDHMFMGAAHCSRQGIDWIVASRPYVDFLGFNIYGLSLGWLENHMPELQKTDFPFTVLEFSFVCETRGMPSYSSGNTVATQKMRGEAYRHFTENAAANPLCIGFGFFLTYDQPVTGRGLNGENFNFGLFNQQDQPYVDMLNEVVLANNALFDVHAGRPPFRLAEPEKLLLALNDKTYSQVFLPGSTDSHFIVESEVPKFCNGEKRRLKLTALPNRPGVYCAGVGHSGDGQRFNSFRLTAHLWENMPEKDITKIISVEESPDNSYFTPVPLETKEIAYRVFHTYELTPAQPLKADTQYLRIMVNITHPQVGWGIQVGKVQFIK